MATSLQTTSERLSVALLNINGLRHKMDYIRHIISRDKVHVFALCETKLDASVEDRKVGIPGFRLWRRDRKEKKGGGVALYVKNDIEAKERTDLMRTTAEIIWVELDITGSRPVLLGCFYRPPNSDREYLDKLYENMTLMLKEKEEKDIFVMGDFNIDWSKDSLLNYIALKVSFHWGFQQIVEDPTRVTDTSATCIDHIYTNVPDLCSEPESSETRFSDHNLITVTVNKDIPKGVGWLNQDFIPETFQTDIKSVDWKDVYEEFDLEKALTMFTKKFLTIATKKIYKTLISERDKAEGELCEYVKKQVLKVFNKKTKETFQQTLEEAKNDPNKLLKVLREFLGESLPSYVINITEEGAVTSKVEHLDQLCQTYTGTKDLESIFEGSREDERSGLFSFKEIDAETVKRLLKHLCDHVTHGIYETEAKLLKCSADDIFVPICHILNRCIKSEKIPFEMKEFMRIPSSLNNMTQLRDVNSLHIMLGWILDTVLFLQAKQHFIDESLIPSATVQDEINQIETAWLKATAERKIVQAVFLDFSFSFYTIRYDLLIEKPFCPSFSFSARSLIKSFLSIGQGPCGLPRGSLLSQLLFTVFIKSLLGTPSAVICDGCVMVYCEGRNSQELKIILDRKIKSVNDRAERFNISFAETRPEPFKTRDKDIFDILQSLYQSHKDQLNWIRALGIIMQNHCDLNSDQILEKLEEFW
ncbi:PREDICTED: uncharacterized protein LOC107080829 [Cyprinodon variegatus]|uniref:uncharacterized protein LOC107080829 n=1 Tax=Cyprinodon variegatus TaxID=28743 RepID=UPI0007428654|nr:PREDICTED: uncharacterized protein LOC107080829 [Cyprinodon variegatus]